ncbi:hypothetical protein COLO4_26603 [Corchorus olitorius]|uniref:Uncharacterized protein n=1 Tax=Corchorus olitorius TaxID=93759 RepID=A0A1R3HVV1_9ROSI|nr:hypothetical protein COLO4_26603 [Corchorus olitorius]
MHFQLTPAGFRFRASRRVSGRVLSRNRAPMKLGLGGTTTGYDFRRRSFGWLGFRVNKL